MTLAVIAVAAALGLVPAWLAQRKGRSFVGWWILGTLVWIVAMIAVFVVSDRRPRCPECREPVQGEAARCPHCQAEIAGRVAPAT